MFLRNAVLLLVAGFASLASADLVGANRFSVAKDIVIRSDAGFGNKIYYSCDSAQSAAESLLVEMGATNVSVRCTGGLDEFVSTEAYLQLYYEPLKLAKPNEKAAFTANWTAVELRGFDGCHLNNQIFEQIQGDFELRQISQRRCGSLSSSYRLRFETLELYE